MGSSINLELCETVEGANPVSSANTLSPFFRDESKVKEGVQELEIERQTKPICGEQNGTCSDMDGKFGR